MQIGDTYAYSNHFKVDMGSHISKELVHYVHSAALGVQRKQHQPLVIIAIINAITVFFLLLLFNLLLDCRSRSLSISFLFFLSYDLIILIFCIIE